MPRWVTRLHAWVYRRSGGRVLGRMGGQPVLLLQTTGRRSGQTHTTPVQYLADGDTFVVVASNAGAAPSPGLVSEPARQPARPDRCWWAHRRRSGAGGDRSGARGALATADGRQPLPGARRAQGPTRPAPHDPRSLDADDSAASHRSLVTTTPDPTRRFSSDMLAGLDEPVRRYFSHAISDGAALPNGVRMAMSGRIKVGLWLPFTAEQTVDGRSFTWRARVGRGPLTPLRVTDRYADAAGSTEGRLLGRVTLFDAHDANTARSAATRAAIESVVFAPPSVLPRPWRGLASRDRERHRRPLRPAARATRGSRAHRRTRRDTNRERPALGQRRREDVPVHPLRRRDPRRAPLRRPRASQPRQRRLVVRHPALRAVLPCRDHRSHPTL